MSYNEWGWFFTACFIGFTLHPRIGFFALGAIGFCKLAGIELPT